MGRGDEYAAQAFLNFLSSWSFTESEIKCDQEPATVDSEADLVRRSEDYTLMSEAIP